MHKTITMMKCDGCGEEQLADVANLAGRTAPGMLWVEINCIRHDLCEKNGCADKLRALVSATKAEREREMTK
jgi:hypothetical protein